MRIQGGNVDSYRIPECDLAPTAPVASIKAPPKAPPAEQAPPAIAPSSDGGFLDRIGGFFENCLDAIRGVGRSLADALVAPSHLFEEAAGSALLVLGKTISSVQSLFYLEPAGRPLTERERALAQNVFGPSLNLDVIRLKSGHAGLYSLIEGERPFVLGNAVYTKHANPLSDEDFIHELTHVLQYQRQGAGYIANSLSSQLFNGNAATYDYASQVAQGKTFAQLGHEQQAELIGDAFAQGAIKDGQVVRPFIVRGVDCTAPLRAALAALRESA